MAHEEFLAIICQGLRPRFNIKVPQLMDDIAKQYEFNERQPSFIKSSINIELMYSIFKLFIQPGFDLRIILAFFG
ncbi:hypothetical protein C1645_826223 [Glomus cerebriforme]|uniref:Uncharacterized protein n=1 Tax=Glomus cerebriforme TaxID=658196 RepID=A0A397SX02_9GLOM|nr:hypothetical protein C1645_826223 [Glomus cerebriforme]